jgi:hypothetical protein
MAGSLEDDDFLPPPNIVYEPLKPSVNATEVFLLLLCLYSGMNAVFTGPNVNSVDYLIGPGWALLWSVSLIGGAFLALLGVFWRGRAITAIAYQEIGYTAFGIASLARGVALLGLDKIPESFVIFGFAVAVIARVLQLEKRIRRDHDLPGWMKRWRSENHD